MIYVHDYKIVPWACGEQALPLAREAYAKGIIDLQQLELSVTHALNGGWLNPGGVPAEIAATVIASTRGGIPISPELR